MKKRLIVILLLLLVILIGSYIAYRQVIPRMIADAVVSETPPAFIPERLKPRLEAIREPVNEGTEAMIEQMRASRISLDDLLRALENVTKEQVYAFLDEMNLKKPATTNETFDIAKKHFQADFDVEVFREPFNKHVGMTEVRQAVAYGNLNRRTEQVDMNTAKLVVKTIIIKKDKQMSQAVRK